MKKIIGFLMIVIVCLLVSCGYKPKYSNEFYIDYINNYNENAEIYGLEKKDTNLSNKDKKAIDEKLNNLFSE